jgi:hypothetical protein
VLRLRDGVRALLMSALLDTSAWQSVLPRVAVGHLGKRPIVFVLLSIRLITREDDYSFARQ